ncbi:30S ribosomal protein S20 [Sphingobacterium sp. E70]|uniref:30S ribosomal protein S20 n=1 Tax=Sphingobacterium sp. E70 TaxID=2853439 RepID=UPI00211C8BF5|nr:30S ribosomal protein S20 [Sphingobacterium sp. E70]ULT27329.1 30S ribosomal protein S20 [Sphingobacterium sp. E70]
MANHKSAIKRIRANATKRLRNRYQAKTTRNAIKNYVIQLLQKKQNIVTTRNFYVDRLAKKNVIHKKKASNNKSKLTKFVNGLA